MIEQAHCLQLTILISLILKDLLDSNSFSSLKALSLKYNTEGSLPNCTLCHVTYCLFGLTVSTTNGSYNYMSSFCTISINHCRFHLLFNLLISDLHFINPLRKFISK